MRQIDTQLESMLNDFEANFALPKTLVADHQTKAVALIEGLLGRVKALYGADIPTSYNVAPNGATIKVKSYCIYSVYDFISFIEEESGCLSADFLIDELLMSFNPNTSQLLSKINDDGLQVVIDDYMPTSQQLKKVESGICEDNMPVALLQAISKANIIHAFICECLEVKADEDDDQVSMTLTITDLVLNNTIKRNGRYYEINGINDIHNAILGFAPNTDLSLDFISEDCMTQMYKKLGVRYIADTQ